jgi:hypothetical protein
MIALRYLFAVSLEKRLAWPVIVGSVSFIEIDNLLTLATASISTYKPSTKILADILACS